MTSSRLDEMNVHSPNSISDPSHPTSDPPVSELQPEIPPNKSELECHGLRLLSLDGGGIRGMSMLLILKQMMCLLQQRENLPKIPLPCEYFDLIGGSSTGGIIAIMLGRLRMSVDDAIIHYEKISTTVFKTRIGFDVLTFDHSDLVRVIKDTVRQYVGYANMKMFDNRKNACKTFVCARTALDWSGHTHIFRTYGNSINCEIWEAVRATSAAPSFFDRIFIGEPECLKRPYIGVGSGMNNPIMQVLKESHFTFPDQSVACIISIGTGKKSTIQIPSSNPPEHLLRTNMSIDMVKAVVEIAVDCETTEELITKRFQSASDFHYRFNVDQGMQLLELPDFDKVENVAAHTGLYLAEENVCTKLQDAISALYERSPIIPASQIPDNIITPDLNLTYNIPEFYRAQRFVARQGMQEKLGELFNKQRSSSETLIVSLIGMGGAGKTQLALEYCLRQKQIGGVQRIFWVDAMSPESVQSDMKNIARLLAPSSDLADANAAMQLVKEILSFSSDPWLMVFDNLDDPSKFDDLRALFPLCPLGGVLIMSRHHDVKRFCHHHILLEGMGKSESFSLLLGHQAWETELEPATLILERIGWIPLAIDQTQAYISKRRLPLQKFIKEFDIRKKHLLRTTPLAPMWQYKRKDLDTKVEKTLSIYSSWEMSLSTLKSSVGENFSVIEDVLTLLAFFHPNAISEKIFSSCIADKELLATPMMLFKEDINWNHEKFELTITNLQNHSLLQFLWHGTELIISINPLVSEWLRMRLDKNMYIAFIQSAMLYLSGYLCSIDNFGHQECLLHIDTILSLAEGCIDYSQHPLHHVAHTFGRFYESNVQLDAAEQMYQHALEGYEKVLGPDHMDTLDLMKKLALLYEDRGKLEAVKDLYSHALPDYEIVLSADYTETLDISQELKNIEQVSDQNSLDEDNHNDWFVIEPI